MKQTLFARVNRCAVMLSCLAAVVFVALALIACGNSAKSTCEITGVYAQDVYVEYDGNEHGITVNNVIDGDKIFYKTDASGDWVADAPSYIFPGVYLIEYRVERTGCNHFVGCATVTIVKGVLSGISSTPQTVVYDGFSYGISISGLRPTDKIMYSVDGFDFYSDEPSWSEVGEYKVFFTVQRDYGEYRGSGVLVIIPNISGRYLNAAKGIIELTSSDGTVNGERLPLEYDCSAKGKLGENDFQVSDGILTYNGEEYAKIETDDIVYALKIDDRRIFFLQKNGVTGLTVNINLDGAEITYNGTILTTVSGVNYCETGIITDYVDLAFELPLVQAETEVVLSLREKPTDKDLTEIIVYDGQAHGFELGEEYVFLTEQASYVDVGRYTATVVELSDVFLPTVRTATLVILPDIVGVYVNDATAIQITECCAIQNFTELAIDKTVDGWVIDGKNVQLTLDGIKINGDEYTRASGRVLLIELGETTRTAQFVFEADSFMSIQNIDGVIEIEYNGQTIAEIPFTVGDIVVTVGGEKAQLVELNGVRSFIIGESELIGEVVHVIITVE